MESVDINKPLDFEFAEMLIGKKSFSRITPQKIK
jgi:hypothetical protein